ncbi:S41 family peptidase [Marinicellulosiphila megalodicopiae]|uniref:S41 family peptidase n=1 Tax=Marinicellulosiphila megalodicopiae TaxID=2724896 RepID=UPI003BAF77AE
MYRKYSSVFIVVYALLITACDEPEIAEQSCTLEDKNEAIVSIFESDYLFNEDVQVPADYQVLPSADLVEALKVNGKEDFSFWVEDAVAFDQSFGQGISTGKFGFRPIYIESDTGNVEDDRLTFYVVEKNSPAYEAGLRRGDAILSIDGISKNEIFTFLKNNDDDKDVVNAYHMYLFGYDNEKQSLHFVWRSSEDSSVYEATIERGSYTTNVIETSSVIDNAGQTTGYFAYRSFAKYSAEELYDSFEYFSDQNVDNLILDLRSNSGGLVSLATAIVNSSLNARNSHSQLPMLNYEFNSLQSINNRTFSFWDNTYDIGASEVVVLIDSGSCSASELVINMMLPYANVTVIGDHASCGKPFAMPQIPICGSILFPVTMQMTNANNEGNYINGFNPDCVVADTLMYNWGNVNDPQIDEALHILNGGSCRTQMEAVALESRNLKKSNKHFQSSTYLDYENSNSILIK